MRKKPTLTRGIAVLALSASVFLGCQDFLSEDKSAQNAKTASEEKIQVAAQDESSQDTAAECKDIFAQMQTAKDPLYGELKNRFGNLNCDLTQAAGPSVPPTPPDSATICNNFKTSLAEMDPSSTKYLLYLEQIAIYCTAKP